LKIANIPLREASLTVKLALNVASRNLRQQDTVLKTAELQKRDGDAFNMAILEFETLIDSLIVKVNETVFS
jgi:hypothetical protein